jgi:uncharacterized protein
VAVHELSRTQARRIAVRAQLLDRPRPTALLDVVRRLAHVQIDATAAVAPSADLVAWSRLGSAYARGDFDAALQQQTLIELQSMIRLPEDLALHRADMAAWPGTGDLADWREYRRNWVATNDACRRDILERLRQDGPLTARALPDTCQVPWTSTGWTDRRNVAQMLEFMVQRGEVAAAGRQGRDRPWDLAERVYPDDPVVPADEARPARAKQRLHALGIARARPAACSVEPADLGEAGEPAVVEGVRGAWRVDPSYLTGSFSGRAALLSPFDQLVQDRKRTVELFDFDYQLEMYKPAAKRRWGYYALPILYGDRLVGKVDAAADRKAGALRVNAVHEDEPFSRTAAAAVRRELVDLARWLDLELVMPA